jgi:O-antigen/teichoic acid export membrane protein
LFFIFLLSSLLLLLVTAVWYSIANHTLVKKLILLSFIQVLLKEFFGLFLIVARLEGKAVKYNLVHSTRAILSFGVLYGMAFGLNFDITAVLISTLLIDGIVLAVTLIFGREGVGFSIRSVSRAGLRVLIRFGSIGLASNFLFLLITSSDRYIIALFTDMSTVGIYNQVYNISQLSIVALVTVYFNTINPTLNRVLELHFDKSNALISKYLHAYLLIGLPLVTYLSMFPKEIATILLGPEFRSGYTIMPWIFISAFLYGLFLFIEIKFKFADKLRKIVLGVGVATLLNVIINVAMIPQFGYQWAAISTFIAYVFLVFYFYLQDATGFFNRKKYLREILLILLVVGIQIIADQYLRSVISLSVWQTVLEGIVLYGIYLLIFYKKIRRLKVPI